MAAPRWLAGLWLVAVGRCSDEDRGGRRRPVVLVVADDFRPQVGAFGFDDVETPHLDRLVAGGVSFTRAYAQAPSCNPSRTSFLTGLYPDVTKVFYFEGVAHLTMGARGELDVFTHLRSHGFLTFGVGKLWHWEPVGHPFSKVGGPYFPEPGTYDQEWGCADGEKDGGRCAPTSGQPFLMGKVFPTDDPVPSLFDYRVASNAIAKLRVGADAYARQRRPFLLGCGFHHPHTKWRVPRPLYERLKKRRRVAAPDAARRTVGAPVHAFGDVDLGVEIDRRFGTSRPNFRTLELGPIDVDSADVWTNRWLSSNARRTADASGALRSTTRASTSGRRFESGPGQPRPRGPVRRRPALRRAPAALAPGQRRHAARRRRRAAARLPVRRDVHGLAARAGAGQG